MRNHNPTPWPLLAGLQTVLWAVLALCVGNAFGSLTLDPLDLPKADSADTARIREVAEAQSAQILALEEIGYSAEDCVGRELLTKDPMDQFWSPYSYGGGDPLTGADPWGLEFGPTESTCYDGFQSWWNGGGVPFNPGGSGASDVTATMPIFRPTFSMPAPASIGAPNGNAIRTRMPEFQQVEEGGIPIDPVVIGQMARRSHQIAKVTQGQMAGLLNAGGTSLGAGLTLAPMLRGVFGAARGIIAEAPVAKFSDYIFKEGATHGKSVVFTRLGYSGTNSAELAAMYEAQAMDKLRMGAYSLGKLDSYGQRVNIAIELNGTGAGAGQSSQFVTGWMIRADGTVTLNTPFAGFAK